MRFLIIIAALVPLAACNTADRLSNVGRVPALSPIDDVAAPAYEASLGATITDYRAPGHAVPAATVRAPVDEDRSTSLFRTGARAFFRDQRATKVGDILTVRIDIADRADIGNATTRTRTNSEGAQLPAFLGLETKLDEVFPDAINPSNLVSAGSQSQSSGEGQVQRREQIDLTVAAIVTQVLPNGNFVIRGRQEVRVNYEVRELIIAGIVRPEDITRENTVQHTQIAEARVSYGGRGQLSDVQQARWGQQVYDALFPF